MTAKCANFLLGLGLCLTGRAQPRSCDIEGQMNFLFYRSQRSSCKFGDKMFVQNVWQKNIVWSGATTWQDWQIISRHSCVHHFTKGFFFLSLSPTLSNFDAISINLLETVVEVQNRKARTSWSVRARSSFGWTSVNHNSQQWIISCSILSLCLCTKITCELTTEQDGRQDGEEQWVKCEINEGKNVSLVFSCETALNKFSFCYQIFPCFKMKCDLTMTRLLNTWFTPQTH